MIADFPAPGEHPVGGPQMATSRLVSKLVERGVDVVVVAPCSSCATEAVTRLEDGAALVTVPAGRRWTLARGLQPWRKHARAVVDRIGADVVHGQGLLPGGIAAVDMKGHPSVVTARGSVRADTAGAYRGAGRIARAYLSDRIACAAVERADVVIGVNPDWRVNLPRRPKRFAYIPNMIDEQFFRRRREPERGLVLFAGGARAIKGWALLAEAWPRVRAAITHAQLNVIGWPPEQTPPGISSRDRESLVVEGWLSSSELAERMVRASALVIPSQFEVSPIVLAEAWALGLPVVGVPVGGIPALATGAIILVERQPEALAEGIIAALVGGPEIDRFVEEGRRRAEAHRADAVATVHVALYRELVHEYDALRTTRPPLVGAARSSEKKR
jgi:glycosyltransferase involved in cell wall biosynthesis